MNSQQAKRRTNADNNNRNKSRDQQNRPKHQKKEKFYNVYQFVPFDSAPSKQIHSVGQIKRGNTHIRHDGWFSHTVDSNGEQTELYSGRIVCEIKTLSPTFVGNGEIAEKHPQNAADNSPQASTDEAKTVTHYTTANGELAFPASSLRGMISNIAEAISNSPMRVINDQNKVKVKNEKNQSSRLTIADMLNGTTNNYLPFGQRQNNQHLHNTESLFGAVKQDNNALNHATDNRDDLPSLASRLQFSDAIVSEQSKEAFEHNMFVEPFKLQLLSPNTEAKNYVQKRHLHSKSGQTTNQFTILAGRKFYPVQPVSSLDELKNKKWTENQQKMLTTFAPVKQNVTFYFTIDFNNLSGPELGLLLLSIQPQKAYVHRLGLGKPEGFGQVQLTPIYVAFSDYSARYHDNTLTAPRYPKYWKAPNTSLKNLPNCYQLKTKGLTPISWRTVEFEWKKWLNYNNLYYVQHFGDLTKTDRNTEYKYDKVDTSMGYKNIPNPQPLFGFKPETD